MIRERQNVDGMYEEEMLRSGKNYSILQVQCNKDEVMDFMKPEVAHITVVTKLSLVNKLPSCSSRSTT